jgi:virginiamycin B lyase
MSRGFFTQVALLLSAVVPAALGQARPAASAPVQLPDGTGKEVVQESCGGQCHSLNRVTNAGHTPAEWQSVVAMMVNQGAKLPKERVPTVVEYLAKNFPPRNRPAAVEVAGAFQVTIKEWDVPTPGSRPHDPLATPDGLIWYTGQMASKIGRVDPRTGQFKEYDTKTPGSGPHGLVADAEGNIWFTANFKAYIGKLDPKTGQVTEYPMPDPNARDPHTPIFDKKGILWFTAQGANMVGRLDPKTGQVKLVKSPTPRSNPYGMVIRSDGMVFFDEFGTNKIGSIDPGTMEIHEYPLPESDARPRRIAITSDDIIWFTDYARGMLGRLDSRTGKVTEYPSPGGATSQPYGIAAVDDALWYSESGVQPNTMVRFDPRTEKFQTWTIPSGGGVVRNMSVTRDGNIAIACSGVNKVGVVEIRRPTS